MYFSPARYVKNEFKIRGRRRWLVVTVDWLLRSSSHHRNYYTRTHLLCQ